MNAQVLRALLGTLACLVVFSVPAGAQTMASIAPGENGMDTSFARIGMEPRPSYWGPATPVEARFLIKNGSGVQRASTILVAFNGLSDSVDIEFRDLRSGGAPVDIDKDERNLSRQQPKVWLRPQDVPLDREVVMRANVTAHNNGQFHVGVLVIAFDAEYEKFVTPKDEYAEVYAFGLLRGVGVVKGAAAPPFEGQGNVPDVSAVPAVVAVLVGAALGRRR